MDQLNIVFKEIKNNFEENQNARRLFHGRGGTFSGFENINIDWICPYILIEGYENLDKDWLKELSLFLKKEYSNRIEGIFYRNRKENLEYQSLFGNIPSKHKLCEDQLCYEITFNKNQNYGFFLDMLEGRRLLKKICKGKKVLNLFAYTCSFSVVAIKHGASEVINVDMKSNFLTIGRKNHIINDLPTDRVTFLAHDIMKSLGKIERLGPYDIIIIDPPTLQKSHFDLDKDYAKIIKRLSKWCDKHGDIIACLNSPFHGRDFLIDLANQHYPELKIIKVLGPPTQYKENDDNQALKIIHFSPE